MDVRFVGSFRGRPEYWYESEGLEFRPGFPYPKQRLRVMTVFSGGLLESHQEFMVPSADRCASGFQDLGLGF
jgi:hypothetical protein